MEPLALPPPCPEKLFFEQKLLLPRKNRQKNNKTVVETMKTQQNQKKNNFFKTMKPLPPLPPGTAKLVLKRNVSHKSAPVRETWGLFLNGGLLHKDLCSWNRRLVYGTDGFLHKGPRGSYATSRFLGTGGFLHNGPCSWNRGSAWETRGLLHKDSMFVHKGPGSWNRRSPSYIRATVFGKGGLLTVGPLFVK